VITGVLSDYLLSVGSAFVSIDFSLALRCCAFAHVLVLTACFIERAGLTFVFKAAT